MRKRTKCETPVSLPPQHDAIDALFDRMQQGEMMPPRSQQAVDAGLVAHAFSDKDVDPAHYRYYHWVRDHCAALSGTRELSAQLIGMAFVSANVFATSLPQPLTLNPWQVPAMGDWPLAANRAVVIENNGVFIWLHHRHPDWPLIAQGGNDFQPAYLTLMQRLVARGLQVTYLGDLDATGIRIADTLKAALPDSAQLLVLQTPPRVMGWLSLKGKRDDKRTQALRIADPTLQTEMDSIAVLGRFVEQEQLIGEYEALIAAWLMEQW
ncbi:DUF2399 domain-containing protein [Lacticaseibacillus daqingensis]|uniref:DUF2399 domain-containing protein n=1 Tax=Lacticaseibacillus daqingensis TaxID=2486014 RepID=UPI001CDC93BB|nr:DUF2399 domain-containing protein [Lacticaseibacillus daqingensis]